MSGQNEVEISAEGLAAELAAVELPQEPGDQVPQDGVPLAPPAVPAGEPTLEQLQAAIPQWKMGSDFMVNALADAIAPNWAITKEERDKLSDSISMALEAWFPGQYIPIRFQVLLGVGVAVWGIITVRRQAHQGKLPPLRLAQPKGAASTNASPASSPVPARTGGATTSA